MLHKFLLTCICLFSSIILFAAPEKVNLLTALKSQQISLSAESNENGYNKKGLTLAIQNNSKKDLLIYIDPALLFSPEDKNVQPLLIEGKVILAVMRGKTNQIALQSYCHNSSSSAPSAALKYTFTKQEDSTHIKLIEFIIKNNIEKSLAQKSVWVLSNHHELNEVYQFEHSAMSKQLTDFLAQLLNKPVPQYFTYKELLNNAGASPIPKQTLALVARVNWKLAEETKLSLSIYDKDNNKLASYFENKAFIRGRYELDGEFSTTQYPSGTYYIRLYSDNAILQEIVANLQ